MKKLYLNWNNKNTLRQFIEQMEYCKSSSEKEVNIVAPDRMRTYPDICAPLSALIDEYKDRGYKFTFNFPTPSAELYFHILSSGKANSELLLLIIFST